MIEKVDAFPIEELYFLESEDFLVHREKFYFKKNKTIKINSYWLGVSRLRVNNDKLLYLFNGLRGYYDVRTRYLKAPKIMEKKVPLSKIIYVNDYLIKKYKYKDLFIFSLNLFNRPTITLQKENNILYYWFPTRLAESLNKKREIKTMKLANQEFSKQVRELKNIGFKFSIRYKNKGLRKLKILPSIAVGLTEGYLVQYLSYLEYLGSEIKKMIRCSVEKPKFRKKNPRKRSIKSFIRRL